MKPVKAVPFLREKTGETVDTLGIGGEIIAMQVDCDVRTGDILRGLCHSERNEVESKTLRIIRQGRSFGSLSLAQDDSFVHWIRLRR